MIVWGGFNDIGPFYLNTGGRYCTQPGPTPHCPYAGRIVFSGTGEFV